jgi:hypothetical protein
MPDGALIWGKFQGVKTSFFDLPADAQIGDARRVLEGGQRLWVWYTLARHESPSWGDP